MSRAQVCAAALHVISEGFFRIGSERYAREHGTFGLTTLRRSHVRVDGESLCFEYVGKLSKQQRQVLVDRGLASFVRALKAAPAARGGRLFRYREGGRWRDLSAREVNEYVRELTGKRYTAKDFRTWGGTLRVATVLAELGPAESERERKKNVVAAIRMVAAELGNTPAICRKSYVHPIVIARYLDTGETISPRRMHGARSPRSTLGHHAEERALIRFLDRHFPERRRALREDDLVAA